MKELKGFQKVFLQPNEDKVVTIQLDRFATSFWDETECAWLSEAGIYKISVGSSSDRILLEGELDIRETSSWTGL